MRQGKILKIIIQAAVEGGEATLRFFNKNFEQTQKPYGDVCTSADLAAERKIIGILKKEFPSFNIIAEETGIKNNNSEYTFAIDPLDGTSNFKIGSGIYASSIGVIKNGEIIAGAIYAPVLKQLFWAEKGKGAYLNNRRIKVLKKPNLTGALIAYSQGWCLSDTIIYPGKVKKLYENGVFRVLNNWAPAIEMCWLADGKIHGTVANRNDIYDVAAGKIIVREAGGKIIAGDDKKDLSTFFVAGCTNSLTKQLSAILKK